MERADKLKVPLAGLGWGAAVLHLQNAFAALSNKPEKEATDSEAATGLATIGQHITKALEDAKKQQAAAATAAAAAAGSGDQGQSQSGDGRGCSRPFRCQAWPTTCGFR